jgi:hypothetical protein
MLDRLPSTDLRTLIAKLPRTFGPALNGQISQWDLLFPAEQRRLLAQAHWMLQAPKDHFEQLFKPIREIEAGMQLPKWDRGAAGISVQEAGLIARSPLYAQWRSAVEKAFAAMDELTAADNPLRSAARLVITMLPGGIPLPKRLWPELEDKGQWVDLEQPLGELLPPLAEALGGRQLLPALDPVESTWVFASDDSYRDLTTRTPATVVDWQGLGKARAEFLQSFNKVSRDLEAVDSANSSLKRLKLQPLLEPHLARDTRIVEFIRSLLLSGNGALVFNNSFVQWGAAEALRRVMPQVLIASFGVRPKLKPFSSSVLFEDQNRANPVADQDDARGSAVDAALLASYVHLSALRLAPVPERSVTLLGAASLNRVLLINAAKLVKDVPLTAAALRITLQQWLAS